MKGIKKNKEGHCFSFMLKVREKGRIPEKKLNYFWDNLMSSWKMNGPNKYFPGWGTLCPEAETDSNEAKLSWAR